MVEQKVEGLVDFELGDDVIVVQNQSEPGSRGNNVVDQRGQQVFDFNGRIGVGLQDGLDIGADTRMDPLQGGDHVAEKARHVVV